MPWGNSSFDPKGITWEKFRTGPLEDAKYQNIKALCLPVSEKNFKVFLLCPYVRTCDPPPWGETAFDPRGLHMNKLCRGPLVDASY